MDCHVFRRLCDELIPALTGARMEKIHQPAEDVVTFSLYASGRKQVLFCKFGRKAPFLFLSSHRIPVGAEPPAPIMRLRKYLSGQRVSAGLAAWAERRLLLRFHELPQTGQRVWLNLDLREGPRLLLLSASPKCPDPAWPDPSEVAASGLSETDWRAWPVLSPALRRTLTLLEPAEQAALLTDLEYGGGDLFAYNLPEQGDPLPGVPVELSAWPLPPTLRGTREERTFSSAIQATTLNGEKGLLEELAHRAGQQSAKVHKDAAKRIARLLDKLHGEQQRLETMAGRKADALALQAELYRFQATEKAASVQLDARPGAPLDLDPRYTVRENMARWFHQAARGERGLAMLAPRLATLRAEQQRELQQAEQAASQRTLTAPTGLATPSKPGADALRKKTTPLPKNVQAFQSDDGFLLLRGRDADGNAKLLKLASPHDYWLHVGGAASAHVLIRRAHARQDVPERTLLQAGLLAAQKSERQHDARADIVAALARHVRPLKTSGGRRPGNVRIDEIAWTRSVPLDGSVSQPTALSTPADTRK